MANYPEGPWGVREEPKSTSGDAITFFGLWGMWLVSMVVFGISTGHIAENSATGEFDIEKGWENAVRFSLAGLSASSVGLLASLFFIASDSRKET